MNQTVIWFKNVSQKRFFRYGLPFMVMLLGGSFGLSYFTSLRYEFRKRKFISPEEAEELGLEMRRVTIEEEYDKLKQEVDIDTWENIRGPRPWEEDTLKVIRERQTKLGSKVDKTKPSNPL